MSDIADRLRQARLKAGFKHVVDATQRFGWKYPTYAGHENGSRGVKRPDVLKYAAAYGVDPAWLEMGGTDDAPRSQGMAEQTASFLQRYIAPTDTMRRTLAALTRAVASVDANAAPFFISQAIPGLALIPGDVVVADLSDLEGHPGDVMICQVSNEASATARLDLRLRSTSSGCVIPYAGQPIAPGERETIMGRVILTLRGVPA